MFINDGVVHIIGEYNSITGINKRVVDIAGEYVIDAGSCLQDFVVLTRSGNAYNINMAGNDISIERVEIHRIVNITCEMYGASVLTNKGEVYSWKLPLDTKLDRITNLQRINLNQVISIGSGMYHSIAMCKNQSV
eukprot:TRINITY_DN2340_c0_g1_i1.p1 TRINITY_DN2340_c0_g1~~TRINITY_DN2340_c0_g1_i1.p1  ORF type:complete len:135 (+),score=22.11 TRINITY_DN2340_c0_g1_i1:523-927(+)